MINRFTTLVWFTCVLLFFMNVAYANESTLHLNSYTQSHDSKAKIAQKVFELAIIMDDIGAKSSDELAFSLPRQVTFAVLPHTEFSTRFSYKAASQNREVMLHMPMESLHDVNLGPYPLLSTMYPAEVRDTLLHALQTVPHAVGVNNHMGSKLTQMTLQMDSVMQVLSSSNLFFIDSKTTKFSKANEIAQSKGVKTATRHIFLDHEKSLSFLQAQYERAIELARQHGKAILIAHPYDISIDFLARSLTLLPMDIKLVTVSEFLEETHKFRINPHLITKYQTDKQTERLSKVLQSTADVVSPD